MQIETTDGAVIDWPGELPEPRRNKRRVWVYDLPEDVRALAIAKGWRTPADAIRSYMHLESLLGRRMRALEAD